jgi:hypothetical protein
MKYGIILGGNSSNSKIIFTLQKKTVTIIAGVTAGNSCRSLFMRLEILPLPCEYLCTLLYFVVNNQELFQTNSAIHNVNTTKKNYLHRPVSNLSCFQKVYNMLASESSTVYHQISKSLINRKAQFKVALKMVLQYSLLSS